MELIALLSSNEETYTQVSGLINKGDWDKIIVLGNNETKTSLTTEKDFEFIQIDLTKRLVDLKKEILEKLKPKISGLEVALTIASGNGKEHMALCSALLSIPTGIRFTALTKSGIIYL